MSVTKPVVKKALSTDMLPGGLSDRQRFLSFAELFEHFSNTGELDPAEDVPFRAAMNSITIGTTLLGRCDGTFRTVRRGKRLIQMTNDDRYCLARHTGAHAAQLVHRGREFTMRPGSLVLLKLDEPFHSADGTNTKKFTNVHLPVAALRGSVRGIDDLVGRDEGWEVICAGDVCYERAMAEAVIGWLGGLSWRGATVLIGDPGRSYLPKDKLTAVATYEVPVTRALEDAEIKRTAVWTIRNNDELVIPDAA